MRQTEVAKILRKIADAIERSSVETLEDFDIELKPRRMRTDPAHGGEKRSTRRVALNPAEVKNLLEQLKEVSTREAAYEILEKLDFTRRGLEDMARDRNVHVTKDDNVQRIKEKLVEVIVGSRLNSAAIRGK